jgi:hypothetical protein
MEVSTQPSTKGNPMKTIDPRVTIQNTDSGRWLVTTDNLLSGDEGMESISFTVLVDRSQGSLPEVVNQAVKRAILLLQAHNHVAKE